MQTQWNAAPGELSSDRLEELDEFDELERVNADLAATVADWDRRIVSVLGEARQQRATLRQLAEAALAALPGDDRASVAVKFGFVTPTEFVPF